MLWIQDDLVRIYFSGRSGSEIPDPTLKTRSTQELSNFKNMYGKGDCSRPFKAFFKIFSENTDSDPVPVQLFRIRPAQAVPDPDP